MAMAVKLMIWIAACMGVIVLVAYSTVRFEQNRAVNLIRTLSNVTPGKTPQVNIQNALEGEPFLTRISNACENSSLRGCDQFAFSNRLLAILHLAPAKWVWVTLDYRSGVVISKSVQFAEEPRRTAVTRQSLQDTEPSIGRDPPGRTVTVAIANSQNAIVKVYDDENVSTDQRQSDWQVDLSCLSRLGACIDPRVILPGAFSRD
jgi:hypothetical protein